MITLGIYVEVERLFWITQVGKSNHKGPYMLKREFIECWIWSAP